MSKSTVDNCICNVAFILCALCRL